MNTSPPILVACIGNIFLGDDAFGVEVARKLLSGPLPDGVQVEDFGIRGLDLTYALLEQHSAVILVDAVPRGEKPGTLFVIEPDLSDLGGSQEMLDAHTMNPLKVLRAAIAMGAQLPRVLLVGCEPTPMDADTEMSMELSPPVAAALDEAAAMVRQQVEKILEQQRSSPGAGAVAFREDQGAGKGCAL